MEAALDAGAEDVTKEDEVFVVSTTPTEFHAVQEALKTKKIVIAGAELAMVPKNSVSITAADATALFKLIETIEDLDDVQKVWANFDIDAAEMAKVEAAG
jgi:transcriptional/translational regulatory protein YebC/TACO1